MEKTKNIEEHVRLVALGAAQISYNISYAQDKRGLYDPDDLETKERTRAIAENLYYYYMDALEQLSGRDNLPVLSVQDIG